MALTFPNPPTPPTPPTPPKVVLEGGGSVKDMPRPKSYGPMSGDAVNEQKAKDAVAKGSGPLSKTTTVKDDSRNTDVQGKINQEGDKTNAKENAAVATKTQEVNQDTKQTGREEGKYLNLKEFEDSREQNQTQTQATTQTAPFKVRDFDTGHGVLYWGFTIISVLALLIYLAKKFLVKNPANKYAFSKRDLSSLTAESDEAVAEIRPKSNSATSAIVKNYETQKTPKKKLIKSTGSEDKKQESGHFEVRV